MVLDSVFDAFVRKSPETVMARGMMERAFNPEQLDHWFESTAEVQYTRDLLFSSVFNIMSQVVFGHYPSVHGAFQDSKEEIGVSITSLYNKLNGIESHTSAELVRYAAGQIQPLIEQLGGSQEPLMPGFNVKLLDGNCIAATEHRIKELRSLSAGPLPGKSLVVYDPSLRIPIDVFPCEDGHAQERSLLQEVLPTVKSDDLWVADRNFCVRSFLFGIHLKGAYFIIREHKKLPYTPVGKEKACGSIDGVTVFEQDIIVTDESGKECKFRRIRIVLKKATRDGDKEICLIANLSKRKGHAKQMALLYRKRWRIETAFQELTVYLNCEINTLGYPPAAIFAFCVALVSYMILSIIKAALSSVYGADKIDKEFSGYYLAHKFRAIYPGMMIAVPDDSWLVFRRYNRTELVEFLKYLANNVKLSKFKKHPRGPKKPVVKRKRDPKHPHVSTARLLAARKK
jgi:IS4 transposase